MSERVRHVLVGAGSRSMTYTDALVGPHRDHAELVAICDPSPTRIAWHNERLTGQHKHPSVSGYAPDDFERMLRERRAQRVIITAPDYLHHDYAIRSMEAGCDVVCEKPLTIDGPKLRGIFDTRENTGRDLRVALNARYMPEMLAVRRAMMDGAVGRPLAADLAWVLDTSHGADYFRRWHRQKDKSGGLLVHKASHHFDLMNWFLGSWPREVFALADLKFYGRANAQARGESYPYDRYTGAAEARDDPFAIALDRDESTRRLYLDAEKDSGYVRDRNVFGDGITIEDTISLTARYLNGVLLTYSLLAYSPWEGLRLAITGTKARLELYVRYSAHITRVPKGREDHADAATGEIRRLTIHPMFGIPYDVPIRADEGGHGGADPAIMNDLFSPDPGPDPLGCRSNAYDAAASVLLGISANESIASGNAVRCDDLFALPDHGQDGGAMQTAVDASQRRR